MPWITVYCPRPDCGADIDLELEVVPGENYGTDADGNRGMYMAAYCTLGENPPAKCVECGAEYTQEELSTLTKQAENLADDYQYEPPDPYDL